MLRNNCSICLYFHSFEYIAASGSGDPHISTLDGKEYTFNGLGEYVLLQTDMNMFTMLGRTEQTLSSNGEFKLL